MNRLENISETLDTEVKGWLDPADSDDQARIARACIALHDHSGGTCGILVREACHREGKLEKGGICPQR